MTGTKQSGSKGVLRIGSISIVLTGIALATTVAPLSVFAAGTKPLPIERIGFDNTRQLVVQFAKVPGAFPSIPNVLDSPGPNHRVVVDFADTTIDRAKIPTVEEMTTAMSKILPVMRGIRYSTLPNAAKPTARIVLEMPEDLKVTAHVVNVDETSVTINLGEEVKNLIVPKKTTTKGTQSSAKPAAVPVPGGGTTLSAMSETSAPVPSALDSTPEQALGGAPVASAPVASAPVAAAPVAAAVETRTVTTTHYDTVAAPPVLAGQPVVSADGETVVLKGEQKIDQVKVPTGATKSATSATGWDWNSPVENELATKVAETKTMADDAPAVSQAPQAKDDAEEALIKKVAARELGIAPAATPAAEPVAAPVAAPVSVATPVAVDTPVVATAPVAVATPVANPVVASAGVESTTQAAAPVEALPVAAVREAADTAPVAQLRQLDSSPVAVTEAAPSTVTEVSTSETAPVGKIAQSPDVPVVKTETIETQPLTLPTELPKTAAPAAPAAVPTSEAAAPETSGPALSLKLYNSAVRNHLSGKLPEAISDYKGALAANPSLAEAHSNLGLIYNQQHNYAGALGEFHKALAINPKDAITYNGIGAALRAEKDLAGAIKNWQTAVDIDPKLATAHYNLGTAFEIQKDYDRALEAYKDAVTNDYRLGEAYYRMGLILQQKHRLEDAESQYKEALKVSATSEYSADAKQRLADLKTQKK